MSSELKEKVTEFCRAETSPSPSKKDFVRKRTRYRTYEYHTVHFLFEKRRDLYDRFKQEHSDVQISCPAFKRLIPFWVRKGGRETCLCG